MVQKHRRKEWGKIYVCTKSTVSAENSLKFEDYEQKHPYPRSPSSDWWDRQRKICKISALTL